MTKNIVSEGVKFWGLLRWVQDHRNFTFTKTSAFRLSGLFVGSQWKETSKPWKHIVELIEMCISGCDETLSGEDYFSPLSIKGV